ncbi:hypothetical protein AB6N24_18220 [Cellulomonas sp. 179-A 4D5 NHS]|uniref:hypothetical protein n=1 Tax=Cellulomonas sp. 179-A 4D5 NHS TaxID=3142378 RepID=UPI00399F0C4D
MSELTSVLKEKQRDLVRETEPDRLAALDEDELIALHSRVRRARRKHQKNYRRKASAGVEEHGGRGMSRPRNARARQRAEVFEDALARVSGALEVRARKAAEELRDQRLADARANRSTGPGTAPSAGAPTGSGTAREHQPTTGDLKRDASSLAAGARRQAARDSR